MDLPVAGSAWPEEHAALLLAIQALEVGLRVQGLRRAGGLALRPA